ncbi:MAG: hypothetical protein OEZ39_19850 [Gammaproteobacteria bacterium]|nr:hypothetical protein [Gammaproteobacteria bacterium]MDH5654122.1 hypothetical protein [Gammaproteobacteria bacterium]
MNKFLISLLFLLPLYTWADGASIQQHPFLSKEYFKNINPGSVKFDADSLAKCAAMLNVVSQNKHIQYVDADAKFFNSATAELYLFLAMQRDKKQALQKFNEYRAGILQQKSTRNDFYPTREETDFCIKVFYLLREEVTTGIDHSIRNTKPENVHGIWIEQDITWDKRLSSRHIAFETTLVRFEPDGNVTFLKGHLEKTPQVLYVNFTGLYLLAKGKWSIKDDGIVVSYTVISNTRKGAKPAIGDKFEQGYFLLGEKMFGSSAVLVNLNSTNLKFGDKLNLLGLATAQELQNIDWIRKVIKKESSIMKKKLRGEKLTDEEKAIADIDQDKLFFDYTDSEIKERDELYRKKYGAPE